MCIVKPVRALVRQVGRDGWLALGFMSIGVILGAVMAVAIVADTICRLP